MSSAVVADGPVPFQIVDPSQEFWDPYRNVENELFAKLLVILELTL
jgi:hypothetical protein